MPAPRACGYFHSAVMEGELIVTLARHAQLPRRARRQTFQTIFPGRPVPVNKYLLALTMAASLGSAPALVSANTDSSGEGVPDLDHVFVIVLENHNSFTSFGSLGIR